MSKKPRPSLGGLIKPPEPHNGVNTQSHNDVVAQLRDEDVPEVSAEEEVPSSPPLRPKAARKPAQLTRPNRDGDAHRSLYAKPETFDLIRRIAFEERIPAQALYREGLALMLQKRGHMKGKSGEDM